MTLKKLQKIRYIKHKIKSLQAQIEENRNYLAAVNLDGMPHGTTVGNPVLSAVISLETLREQLTFQIERLAKEEKEINDFIESLDDMELQTILHMYYIRGLSQEAIGYELYMSHSSVSRKLSEFYKTIEQEVNE